VRLEGDVDFRNGSCVAVSVVRKARKPFAAKPFAQTRSSKPKPKRPLSRWERAVDSVKRMTKAECMDAVMAAGGVWKDRPEWKGMTPVQIAADSRKRAGSPARND